MTATSHPPCDALVVGGGAAGAAAALALARGGARVTLVEREAGPREKVCGEFLGPDAAALLARLGPGLTPEALGGAPIGGARLAAAHGDAPIRLPFRAHGLPRAVLDEALLAAAEGAGARVLRGRAASAAERDGSRWTLRLPGGEGVSARALVLATGKHAFRGHPRRSATTPGGGHLGLKLAFDLAAPLADCALLPLPGGGYAGLQPSAGDARRANLCAALPPGTPGAAEAAREPRALLATVARGSALAARLLDSARPAWDRPLAVAGVPYGFLHAHAPGDDAALYRVGDQFAVVPSLVGEGVAMALAGGLSAADAILAHRGAEAHHAALRARLAGPTRLAGWLARAMAAAPGALAAAARLAPGLASLAAARTRIAAGEA